MNCVIVNILIFSAFTCNIKGQLEFLKEKPETCFGTDELTDRRCCIFPPFFTRDVARECGAMFALMQIDNKRNITNIRREIIDNCNYWRCILTKYAILDPNDKVSIDRYFSHLDKWVNLNKEFNNVVASAKLHCRDSHRLYFPLNACEFFSFQTCIRAYITINCPNVVNSRECHEWKEFYEECKEYFL